ncbi:translation elongation factor Ts [Texas Phoenix palm phytoplasma]|uniref:Elongation factor Ts n=1 Tax=Texas Phoenix palm phytoplasma TaxID=176709 RepID=A0ABS5BIV4_9MOLU|nr:translation elongation factor Ts [Texas Phoenix palm phytoplasma]MBP3059495.1 translation elongation factor Ts [Texas Phoenix palm phytoplasma]
MKITLDMIKLLKQKTQVGILNCKRVLEKTNGDIEKSIILLKKEGLLKAKQMNQINNNVDTAEGLTGVSFKENKAILFELNTETDFVSRNEIFLDLYNEIQRHLLLVDYSINNLQDFLNYEIPNKKKNIQDLILEKTSILKEKIILKRIKVIYKKDKESFGFYKHQKGRISSLVLFSKSCLEAREQIPIHIVGMNPIFISKEKIDSNFLAKKRNIFLEQATKENPDKNLEIRNLIAESRLNNFLNEKCLLEQNLYNNPNQKVKEYLKKIDSNVLEFYRFEVGEIV